MEIIELLAVNAKLVGVHGLFYLAFCFGTSVVF